ncbi:hypothetical protein ACHAWF_009145 [Thalassiosira exigua]
MRSAKKAIVASLLVLGGGGREEEGGAGRHRRRPHVDGFAPRPPPPRRPPRRACPPLPVARSAGPGSRRGRRDRRPVDDFSRGGDYFFEDDGGGDGYGFRVEDEEDAAVQAERRSASVGCPHFGTCPGCVRDSNVAEIDVVESAKLYFASRSVANHVSSTDRRRYDYHSDDDDDDEFYQVRIPTPVAGWRTQAKLAVAPAGNSAWSNKCSVGLYRRNTHDVLSIPECRVHHPAINRAAEALTSAAAKVRTPPYREERGEGLLRYVQLRVETSTGKVQLALVTNCERLKDAQPHLSRLVKELRRTEPGLWHSIWCHCNDSGGNAIFSRDGARWHPIDGPPYVRESIPGSDPEEREGLLYFSPQVFRQGNLEGFGEIAKEVREAIPPGSKVCELYAGVGFLGLSALLHHGKRGADADGAGGAGGLRWLRCSDDNPENERCFERAAESMPKNITGREPRRFRKGKKDGGGKGRPGKKRGGRSGKRGGSADGEISIMDLMEGRVPPPAEEPSDRVTYMRAHAASALYRGQALGADVLVVDPPRKGLDEAVLDQLRRKRDPNQPYVEDAKGLSHLPRHVVNWTNDVRTLVYVSCGFDALARDLDRLLSAGAGWKLESATGYVLFPGSDHVETVVVLRR